MRHARPLLTTTGAAAALAALTAAGAAAPASAAPFTLVSVTPSPITVPGNVAVRFRITGGAADSTTSIVVRGTEFAGSTLSQEVESAEIRRVVLNGPGSLARGFPVLAGFPPTCERGGIHPSSSISSWVLSVPANKTTDVLVTAKVAEGFAAHTPGVELESGPLLPTGQTAAADAKNDKTVAEIPRTGKSIDGLALKIVDGGRPGTFVATGELSPPRAGALVRIVGRAAKLSGGMPSRLIANQQLGIFADAMRPLGGTFEAYGKVRTTDGGKFKVTFKAPAGTVVIARSRGVGTVTDPGASCPIQLHG